MKKILIVFLVIVLLICFCACEEGISRSDYEALSSKYDELYKQVYGESDTELGTSQNESNIISKKTSTNSQYPYSVKDEKIDEIYSWQPGIMLTSSFPTEILFMEPEVSDAEPTIGFVTYIGSCIIPCEYVIEDIETKKISVKTNENEFKDALVNTVIRPTLDERYKYTFTYLEKSMSERPAYAMKTMDGNLAIALLDYEGSDFDVLYQAVH